MANKCKLCKSDDFILTEFILCNNCGCIIENIYGLGYDDSTTYIKKTYYKRLNYLNEIILSINNNYVYNNNNVVNLIKNNLNKDINFGNIKRLSQTLNIRLNYKQIHSIINQMLNTHYNIDNNQKHNIIGLFLKFERYYNENKIIMRKKKLISYVFLLYKMFNKLGYIHLIKYLRYPLIGRQKQTLKLWNEYYNDFFNNLII